MAAPDPTTRSRPAADDFTRLEALFERVVMLDAASRARILDEECRSRPELRADVESLLAAHDRLQAHGPDEDEPDGIGIGSEVGPYRLTEKIGAGGMGEVFRAERADGLYDQQVAVKLARSTIAQSDERRRFTIERQILASLKHEHIVRLLDGGTTAAGQPFLIMEHVEGLPLTTHCRDQRLSLEGRLQLFRLVCRAVQYAHQHGIVHRDLKPANILVDRDHVPKVVDFGVAKLLEGDSHAGSTATGLAGPLTPNYASPEQLRGLPVTTVSDVYSLGVVLYELVAGVRPYDTAGQTLERVLEIVVHDQPRRPSAAESADLPYSRDRLRGDIDAIVLKAIGKDPSERYASASELADDISRFLVRDPVTARAPSTGYVLRRLALRHKRLASLAAVSLVAILAASGVAAWQWRVAAREKARAEQRFRDVRQLANALIFKIHDAVLPLPGSTAVRRTIVDEAIGYLKRLEAESGGDAALRLELAKAYLQIGGILGNIGAANLGDRDGAIKQYERARQMLQPLAANDGGQDVLNGLVEADLRLSTLYAESGERDKAVSLAHEAVQLAEQQMERAPNDDSAGDLAARAYFGLAIVSSAEEAPRIWRRTLEYYERVLTRRPDDRNAQRNVALSAKYLGSLLETARDWEGARTQYARALELDSRRLDVSPNDARVQFDAAISFSNSAAVAAQLGDVPTATRLFERSLALRRGLAEADPANMQAAGRFGYLLARVASFHAQYGDLNVAERLAREAIPVLEKVYASTSYLSARGDLGFAWLQLGGIEQKRSGGQPAAGCRAFREAAAQFGAADGSQTTKSNVNYAGAAAEAAAECHALH